MPNAQKDRDITKDNRIAEDQELTGKEISKQHPEKHYWNPLEEERKRHRTNRKRTRKSEA